MHIRASSARDLDDRTDARGYLAYDPGNRAVPQRAHRPSLGSGRAVPRPGSSSRGMTAPALCVPGPLVTATRARGPCARRTVAVPPPSRDPEEPTSPDARCRPAPPCPTPPSGFSLPHVAGLVRAAVPPMHPGGRPIVAGVAVAAGLVRARDRARRRRRRAGHRGHRGLLPGAPAGPAAAATGWCSPPPTARWPPSPRCRRRPSWTCRRSRRRGSACSCRCSTCTCSGSRSTGGCWPSSTGRASSCPPTWTRPARTTSATRCCWRPPTAPGSASCRSPGCWPGGSSATSGPATRSRRARPTA